MNCYGCYKPGVNGYCSACRRSLFAGGKTPAIISSAAPANEHCTMQIASQLFSIRTVPSALVRLGDGELGYAVRQEEPGQKLSLMQGATLEETGLWIRGQVAAYPPALEAWFRVAIFNYLFTGDPAPRNFHLIRTNMGDYTLSACYGLQSGAMRGLPDKMPALYKGSGSSAFFRRFGYYGQPDLRELAKRLELMPSRRDRIFTCLLGSRQRVQELIGRSFLNEEQKKLYWTGYLARVSRMGMTEEMIGAIVGNGVSVTGAANGFESPAAAKLVFLDGSSLIGSFLPPGKESERGFGGRRAGKRSERGFGNRDKQDGLSGGGPEATGKRGETLPFVELANAQQFQQTKDERYISFVDCGLIAEIEYPARRSVTVMQPWIKKSSNIFPD